MSNKNFSVVIIPRKKDVWLTLRLPVTCAHVKRFVEGCVNTLVFTQKHTQSVTMRESSSSFVFAPMYNGTGTCPALRACSCLKNKS